VFQNFKKYIRNRQLLQDQRRFEEEFYKKAIVSYPPRHVTIGVTSFCNNNCVFCAYHSLDAKDSSNVYGLNFNLSFDDFTRIIDMCYRGRVPDTHICGTGEPFINKDILKMIDYSIKRYGKASVQTNFHRPIFEKNNYYDELIKRSVHISYITTDVLSGDPDQHNEMKKGSNYEDVLFAMEYINKHCNIKFKIHLILTKFNYLSIDKLIEEIFNRHINADLELVNLHPYNFNEITSLQAPFKSNDLEIINYLKNLEKIAKKFSINLSYPRPFDQPGTGKCNSFWTRFQTWPVKGIDEKRYHENIIIGGCNAVVKGDLSTLGYIFDYENIMDLWNNEYFVKYRTMLLAGAFPDKECVNCQSFNK